MEEQIKKLQEELVMVRIERDNLIVEMNKTLIKTRLKKVIVDWRIPDIKEELVNKDYISAMYKSNKTKVIQELINDYGYDLVVECMKELFLKEKENEKN